MDLKLSVVLPVYNEEGNLVELHKRLLKVCNDLGFTYELIYVNNGSTDKSLEILKSLSNLTIIDLRSSGQTMALDAGIKQAKGQYIITMDSDLQNPPEEIPKLIEELHNEDLDLVSGWRKKRQDSFFIRNLSKLGSWMRRVVLDPGVHDLGCTLKVYRKECFEGIDLYGEMHRYIVAILKDRGFKVGEVVVEHEERKFGDSKYRWDKAFRGFADMWQIWFWRKYSDRPLHLFGVAGIFLTFGGGLGLFVLGILRVLGQISLSNSIWPLIFVLMLILGIQLIVFGVIFDMLIRIYYQDKNYPYYSIKEIISR